MLFALASCGGPNSEDDKPVEPISISTKTTDVSYAASSVFVSVKATGNWTLSLKFENGSNWATLSQNSGTGSKSSIVMSYEKNGGDGNRYVTLVLEADGQTAEVKFTQKCYESENINDPGDDPNDNPSGGNTGDNPGGNTGDNPGGNTGDNPGGSTSPKKIGWMELPETDDRDGLDFYTHSQTIGTVKTRNYSFYYDDEKLVSHWVAYPLNAWTIGNNIKRTDAWGLDPLVPKDKQPVLYKGFGSKYDRGHQCPSADRLYNYSSNAATFYGTNMTPQLGEKFNQSIWANLEVKVRDWANSSDTLYVVTGCVVNDSKEYAQDNEGKKVAVPTAYYKCLLRYSKNSTIGYKGYMGCAIYMPHKNYTQTNVDKSMVMSIADLEKKLGINFFVNLPAAIGEDDAKKVETQDPTTVSWWKF